MGTNVSDDNTRAVREAQPGPLNRRAVLAAGGVAGASAALLAVAGCATYSNGGAPAAAAPATAAGSAPAGGAAANAGAAGQAAAPQPAAAGTAVGPASAVPVGGGKIFADASVVVTQPTAGTFKAFSSTCTHQGCAVSTVSGGTINCPCHGSKFNIADGSVANGPAKKPLPAKQVTSTGGQLSVT